MTPSGRSASSYLPGPGRRLATAIFLCSLLLLAGCETLDKRLTRHREALLRLPPEHQELIRQGRIAVGFTEDEVYLAWGAPRHKSLTESVQGRLETWAYTSLQTETYYREERYYDRDIGVWRFYNRPIYRQLEYLAQEAVFANGLVSSFTIHPSARPYLSAP